MRKLFSPKFVSQLILLVILTMTINGVLESAHAMQSHVKAANDQTALSEISTSHQCLCCSSPEQHKDYDGCDTCFNCICHAPLTNQPIQISYNSSIQALSISEPLMFLPEVFLSKFIPPHIQA